MGACNKRVSQVSEKKSFFLRLEKKKSRYQPPSAHRSADFLAIGRRHGHNTVRHHHAAKQRLEALAVIYDACVCGGG